MLILLALPVFAAVAICHAALQRFSPSNRLVRRARASAPAMSAAAVHAFLAVACITSMHGLVLVIQAGAPRVLYMVVLVLGWDAIKFFGSSCLLVSRLATKVLRRLVSRVRSRRCRVWGPEQQAHPRALEPSVARPR